MLSKMIQATLLSEMNTALEAAKECSQALEKLLTEAREAGGASPELFARISAANKHCEEAMQRYLNAYKSYCIVLNKHGN